MAYVKAGSPQPDLKFIDTLEHSPQDLRDCAVSRRCLSCYVLWGAVEQQCRPQLLQQYLDNWEPTGRRVGSHLIIKPKFGLASFTLCVWSLGHRVTEIGNVNFSSEYGELNSRTFWYSIN